MNPTARDEIFGILRDAYDQKTQKAFGTGAVKSYESCFGVIAGVTSSIDMFSTVHASLGERFLKFRLPEKGGVQSAFHTLRAAMKNIGKEKQMRVDLCEIASKTLGVKIARIPKVSRRAQDYLISLAQWTSAFRSLVVRDKYTGDLSYMPSPEIGTRLAKQLTRLAMGVALFRQEKTITLEVLTIAAKVARDSVPATVEKVVRHLYIHREGNNLNVRAISELSKLPPETVRRILDDLLMLKLVQKRAVTDRHYDWRLATDMLSLMRTLNLYPTEESWADGKAGRVELR
jgi:hypothetical protein